MANEANIDIEINNADVDRLINSLADLSRTLDGLTGEFRVLEEQQNPLPAILTK
jgi:hypothetical protein